MSEEGQDPDQIHREIDYYKSRLNELAGEGLKADYLITGLRKKVRQTRQAFELLSHLPHKIAGKELPDIFETVILSINTSLGMDKTVILTPSKNTHHYRPTHWTGFTEEGRGEHFAQQMSETVIEFPPTVIEGSGLLVNQDTEPTPLIEMLQGLFELPYFVCIHIIDEETPIALILSGRMKEAGIIFPPMDKGDVKIFESIAGVVLATVQGRRMAMLKAENEQKATELAQAKILEKAHRKLQQAHEELATSHKELKDTQQQLIQSEKMASLGELTAGIAHEIQNPLNFVNNFAEVSADMIDEMFEEMEKGNSEDIKAITEDIKQNLDKINHHGKRASSIVKGMLEHSRAGDRQKELTDINVLADEYLRLAYHGLRAKDKSFNAEFKTDFDESIPKVNVLAQDIGRVLLNMINNAFYAVSTKAKEGIENYVPSVVVSTKKLKGKIEIRVKDNGNGIPKKIKDKIFQPFFTTKPTGEGTGLGLSLSYDIIAKGHGGELNVKSKNGKGLPAGQAGTEFIVVLPE